MSGYKPDLGDLTSHYNRHEISEESPSSSTYSDLPSATTATTIIDEDVASDCDPLDYDSSMPQQYENLLEDYENPAEKWSTIAFTLGIPVGDVRRPNAEGLRWAKKLKKRKDVDTRTVSKMIVDLVQSIVHGHFRFAIKENAFFNRDAVPKEAPELNSNRKQKIILPTPRPDITVGYAVSTFSPYKCELQRGIIANSRGDPCDLGRISQTLPGIFWPFLVVNISDQSMDAAKYACSCSASTCNNALMMLAASIQDPRHPEYYNQLLWGLSRAVHSFSLAIHGKEACLNTHNTEICSPHGFHTVRTYRLDDEGEVEELAARIQSIFVWAENGRLESINALLEAFSDRVQFEDAHTRAREKRAPEPMDMVEFGWITPWKKKTLLKTVLADTLPSWTRDREQI